MALDPKKIQPLLMNFNQLEKTLIPYCFGNRRLIQSIKDIWASAIPIPNSASVRMIMPKHFYDFIEVAVKENA